MLRDWIWRAKRQAARRHKFYRAMNVPLPEEHFESRKDFFLGKPAQLGVRGGHIRTQWNQPKARGPDLGR